MSSQQRSTARLDQLVENSDRTVAIGSMGPISGRELLRLAAVIAPLLPEASTESEVAFSFGSDRVAFLAALLATWSRGHTAVLPEDATRENIVPLLARRGNVAFVHDTGVGLGLHVPTLLAEGGAAPPLTWTTSAIERIILVAFRGSSCEELPPVQWTQQEFVETLERLAESMPVEVGSHVVSSLSPTFLEDLLLGVCVPLLRRASFEAKTPADRSALAQQARERSTKSVLTVPAHARELARLPMGELEAGSLLYCVGQTLDLRFARLLADRHSVQLAEAPRVSERAASPEYVDAVQAALLNEEGVLDAAVSVLGNGQTRERRLIAAVVAPSFPARTAASLQAIAQLHLPADLPVDLVLRTQLPRNANGRVPDWKLRLLFGHGRSGSPLESELAWTQLDDGEATERRFRTRIPKNYSFFEGHYTSYPVLAGAVQLHELALPCIRRIAPTALALRRLGGLKFMSRIAPGDEIVVAVREGSEPGSFHFEIESKGARCSSGLLCFVESQGDSSS